VHVLRKRCPSQWCGKRICPKARTQCPTHPGRCSNTNTKIQGSRECRLRWVSGDNKGVGHKNLSGTSQLDGGRRRRGLQRRFGRPCRCNFGDHANLHRSCGCSLVHGVEFVTTIAGSSSSSTSPRGRKWLTEGSPWSTRGGKKR